MRSSKTKRWAGRARMFGGDPGRGVTSPGKPACRSMFACLHVSATVTYGIARTDTLASHQTVLAGQTTVPTYPLTAQPTA